MCLEVWDDLVAYAVYNEKREALQQRIMLMQLQMHGTANSATIEKYFGTAEQFEVFAKLKWRFIYQAIMHKPRWFKHVPGFAKVHTQHIAVHQQQKRTPIRERTN